MKFNEIKEEMKKRVDYAKNWYHCNKDICDLIGGGLAASALLVVGAKVGAKAQYTKDLKVLEDYSAKVKNSMDVLNNNCLDMTNDISLQGVAYNGSPAVIITGSNPSGELVSHTMETTADIAMDFVEQLSDVCTQYNEFIKKGA